MGLQIIDFTEEARGGVKSVDSETRARIKTHLSPPSFFLFDHTVQFARSQFLTPGDGIESPES